jgi:hypothetical protein
MRFSAVCILSVLAILVSSSCLGPRSGIDGSVNRLRDDSWLLYSSDAVISVVSSDDYTVINDFRRPNLSRNVNQVQLERWMQSYSVERVAILLPIAWEERGVISNKKLASLVKSAGASGASVHVIEESSSGVWEISKAEKKSNLIKDYLE